MYDLSGLSTKLFVCNLFFSVCLSFNSFTICLIEKHIGKYPEYKHCSLITKPPCSYHSHYTSGSFLYILLYSTYKYFAQGGMLGEMKLTSILWNEDYSLCVIFRKLIILFEQYYPNIIGLLDQKPQFSHAMPWKVINKFAISFKWLTLLTVIFHNCINL